MLYFEAIGALTRPKTLPPPPLPPPPLPSPINRALPPRLFPCLPAGNCERADYRQLHLLHGLPKQQQRRRQQRQARRRRRLEQHQRRRRQRPPQHSMPQPPLRLWPLWSPSFPAS